MNKCDSDDWRIKLTCRNIISNVPRIIEIIVYPVLASPTTQQEDILIHRRGILRNLMRFEVFRLLSFRPINDAVMVDSNFSAIQFAQEGFYDASGLGHYCCFSCNYTLTDVSANRHHHVNCRHDVESVSIRDHDHLLTSNMFMLFNSNFYNQPFVSEDDHDIHPQRGMDNLNAVNHLLPRNVTLPVNAFPEIYIDENDGIHVSENQVGNSFVISNSQERENHSVHVSASRLMLNGAPQGVALSSENTVTQLQHSLPTTVNEVSGSVGIQESDAADSVVVPHSLSIEPVPFTHTPSQAVIISKTTAEETMNAQNPPEGAVGAHTASFELSGPSYPQFASGSVRKATFTGWNPDHPQRPDDLVAGGFFYAGYADYVKCFNCGLGLGCWTPSDIPAYRHASFRPNCSYNRTINGLEAQRGGDSGTPNNTSISSIESARTETDTSSNCTDSQLLAIISNVPPYANRKIIENPHTPAVDSSMSLLKEKLYALQRENLYLTKRIQCCICHCNHVNCVFLPCGHALACQSCAKKEIGLRCRRCKQLIQDTLKFYL